MTTSIYVPHFAEGKNYTVKYAEILRPCNVLVTAYTQCADNVMREHKYSLRCTTSIAAFNDYTPAVDLSDWTFKSLNADDHIVKIFLQYENGKIYLCADASVVKLIELKTIVPADIVSVNILRLEPLSYIRVEEDEYCLNPHFNSFCFHIALEPGEQSTFIAQSVGGKSVRTSIEAVFQGNPTMNNGLMESVSSGGYERLTISATDERQEFYLMISDIRNLKYFEMPDHVCESFPLSSVRYCDLLTGLHLKEGATGSSASLQSLRHFDTLVVDNAGIDIDLAHFANTRLKWLDIRVGTNTNNLSFTIDALASYDNKSYLESIFFRGEYAHQLQGITGSLGSLSGFRYLRELVIPYTKITGNLQDLKHLNLERLSVLGNNISGNLNSLEKCSNLHTLAIYNSPIIGDLSCLCNLPIQTLILSNINISQDLNALSNYSHLQELYIYNTEITGDISNLSNSNIRKLVATGCNLSGNLSDLPGCCTSFSNKNGNTIGLGWNEKSRYQKTDNNGFRSKILCISECIIKGSDINNMLYDLSRCSSLPIAEHGQIVIQTTDNHSQLSSEYIEWIDELCAKNLYRLQIDDEVFIENGIIL